MINTEFYSHLQKEIPSTVDIVAVSKMQPDPKLLELYNLGQRQFGENKVQELVRKAQLFPDDIKWHILGHLQTNKVKQVLPFVYLIQSVDSIKLLKEIQKEAIKLDKIINVLLQIKIAKEEQKFGCSVKELDEIKLLANQNTFPNIHFKGYMGIATFTDNNNLIGSEFSLLKSIADENVDWIPDPIISMGMSDDYAIAIAAGSNMLRIGSAIFGARNYNTDSKE